MIYIASITIVLLGDNQFSDKMKAYFFSLSSYLTVWSIKAVILESKCHVFSLIWPECLLLLLLTNSYVQYFLKVFSTAWSHIKNLRMVNRQAPLSFFVWNLTFFWHTEVWIYFTNTFHVTIILTVLSNETFQDFWYIFYWVLARFSTS